MLIFTENTSLPVVSVKLSSFATLETIWEHFLKTHCFSFCQNRNLFVNMRLKSYPLNCDKILYMLSSVTNKFLPVLTSSTERLFHFAVICSLVLHFMRSCLEDLFLFALRNAD